MFGFRKSRRRQFLSEHYNKHAYTRVSTIQGRARAHQSYSGRRRRPETQYVEEELKPRVMHGMTLLLLVTYAVATNS